MAIIDKNYHNLLEKILQQGYTYEDPNRKGINRLEIPSYTFRHEFKDGFPAITTKKLNYNAVITELIWFLRGNTNIKYLLDNDCNIWNKDAYNYYLKSNDTDLDGMEFDEFVKIIKDNNLKELQGWFNGYTLGDLGPVYSHQWRNFGEYEVYECSEYSKEGGVDQIERLIKNLKEKPLATDHIVNAWNASDLQDMALPPCHYGFQVVVKPLSLNERREIYGKLAAFSHNDLDNKNITKYGFELHWQQRSVDTFLGLPFNIASYATLALILEKITGYKALGIQGDLKKVHLYDNSLDAVKEQLSRDTDKYKECELTFHGEEGTTMFDHYNNEYRKDITLDRLINSFKPSTFKLSNYQSYPGIKVEMLERDE